jgi:hypothetical protein
VGELPAPAPRAQSAPSIWTGTGLVGEHGVGDAEAEVLVAVETDLRAVGTDLGHDGVDPFLRVGEDECAGGVDHVDTLGAGVDHDAGPAAP